MADQSDGQMTPRPLSEVLDNSSDLSDDELAEAIDLAINTFGKSDLAEYHHGLGDDRSAITVEQHPIAAGQEVAVASPHSWQMAVQELLTLYFTAENTTIWLQHQPSGDMHGVAALLRWMPEKQQQYAAQLDAWVREFCGGKRPSGGEASPTYDDPHISLITLTASAMPDGELVSPVGIVIMPRNTAMAGHPSK